MRIKKTRTSKMSFGCLILFALPFAGIGVGMAVWMVSSIITHKQMSEWVETPAIVLKTELKNNSDNDGSSYKATAEYEYQYGGQKYTGTRVEIDGGSDNIGSFQQDVHRQLSEHKKSDRPFRCFVNPENPAEAVLFRDLRWEMILFKLVFVLAFGTAGFGLIIGAIVGLRKDIAEKKLAAARPDEPWLHKPDWAAGRIKSSNKIQAVGAWAFAILWNSISSGLIFFFMDEDVPPFVYVFLIFPLIGVGMIVWAIIATRRYFKYGESVFQMASMPGVVGGQLAGVIHVKTKVQPSDGFLLKLSCHRKAGEDNKLEWEEEQVVVRELRQVDPTKSAIPVLFNIPYGCLETNELSNTEWSLEVSGGDYKATFEVPVFKTSASDPEFAPDREAIAEYAQPEDQEGDLRRVGVLKMPSINGVGSRFVFPALRFPLYFMCASLFLLAWSSGVVLAWHFQAPILVTGFLCLFEIIIFIVTVDIGSYSSTVDASPLGISVSGGWFGRGRVKVIEIDEIEKIVSANREFVGSRVYYYLVLVRRDGRNITLAKRIVGKHLADSIVDQIKQALGKEDIKTDFQVKSDE